MYGGLRIQCEFEDGVGILGREREVPVVGHLPFLSPTKMTSSRPGSGCISKLFPGKKKLLDLEHFLAKRSSPSRVSSLLVLSRQRCSYRHAGERQRSAIGLRDTAATSIKKLLHPEHALQKRSSVSRALPPTVLL
jgi:hypothetical protein